MLHKALYSFLCVRVWFFCPPASSAQLKGSIEIWGCRGDNNTAGVWFHRPSTVRYIYEAHRLIEVYLFMIIYVFIISIIYVFMYLLYYFYHYHCRHMYYIYMYYLCDHGLRLRMHREGTRRVNQAVSSCIGMTKIAMRLIYGHEIVDLTIGVRSI